MCTTSEFLRLNLNKTNKAVTNYHVTSTYGDVCIERLVFFFPAWLGKSEKRTKTQINGVG